MPVIAVQHPLVRHKIGLLREAEISTKKFRELTGELARLLAYEATADFPLARVEINCWSGPVEVEQIAGLKVTVVPILRAGLGMLDGVLDMIPNAKVSVVGLSRNHETLQPEHYFEKFVGQLDQRTALIVDPMLATAGSMIATIDLLKSRGAKDIRALLSSINVACTPACVRSGCTCITDAGRRTCGMRAQASSASKPMATRAAKASAELRTSPALCSGNEYATVRPAIAMRTRQPPPGSGCVSTMRMLASGPVPTTQIAPAVRAAACTTCCRQGMWSGTMATPPGSSPRKMRDLYSAVSSSVEACRVCDS
eukprot:gene46837-biopygen37930